MKSLAIATAQRVFGEGPGRMRAFAGATAAGAATGVLVYKLLRHEED